MSQVREPKCAAPGLVAKPRLNDGSCRRVTEAQYREAIVKSQTLDYFIKMRPYGFLLPIAIASSYLVPPNLDNSLVKDLPPYLSEQELRNYLEDTFDVVSVHKGKKKLSDYKYQSPREFETVVIGGSFVVYPDAKSGDFDVFFKNKDQEEPEVNAFENEVQAQDEYNRLHNDSRSNLQKQTFNVVNDLDKQPDKDSNKDGKQPK